TVVARDPASTADLREALDGLPTELVITGFDDAAEIPADLVVNATPLGADGEQLPLPPVDGSTLVVDLLYHPAVTPMQTTARDGMVRGAYPEEDEQTFKPAWLKFVHVGEARRGFVEFSDQLWAYVHRGPYAAFVISGTGVRPGVLLDQLEQAVLAAEETRAKKGETLKVPVALSAPSGRPRTSLHPAETKAAPEPAPEPVASAPPADQRAW